MNKIDIKGGQMTYSQRIELGKIISDPNTTEFQKFKACMLCIDPNWTIADMHSGIKYFEDVLIGLRYWITREAAELKYTPTPEELSAGIEVLSRITGEMGTLMALAKDYGKDPDIILEWKYGKVFNILFTNLQSHLYRERLDKKMSEKYKATHKYK